ncbi:uncharacterized protein BO80DRAFT_117008 [Aspergillus ibericus CBS 121593]|uniref:Uncharacterized protein n=1 Tax=Aspergillus ibericus CBS 121593 TaxID=1448316 RepID=A0A395GW83_9EURO|nr:hypothetical protein BO80DRAFT_117008 [Aspergillus ibericus CBS 121593]RAK99840.1 hypothetical protein BO80DRAFT_117008 [Aspergillus ibericus CBS 121593]
MAAVSGTQRLAIAILTGRVAQTRGKGNKRDARGDSTGRRSGITRVNGLLRLLGKASEHTEDRERVSAPRPSDTVPWASPSRVLSTVHKRGLRHQALRPVGRRRGDRSATFSRSQGCLSNGCMTG